LYSELIFVTHPLGADGPSGHSAVVRMKLLGANVAASIFGLDDLPGWVYYLDNDPKKWRTRARQRFQAKGGGV
jgi:hypothetical protein